MNGTLYVVATPIGNLGDITARGQTVLGQVAIIACEDTRRTSALLSHLDIPRPRLLAYYEHNEEVVAAQLLDLLRAGTDVALVSDAGTPVLSDPGFALLQQCWAASVTVVPVPGPSSPMAALSVCPLALHDFYFAGFLPAKRSKRVERLRTLMDVGSAVVFFEAPHRVVDLLEDLVDLAPQRDVFMARELTKQFEQRLCGPPSAVLQQLVDQNAVRGEFVCVLDGPPAAAASAAEHLQISIVELMQVLGSELAPAQAARLASRLSGVKKSELYALALTNKSALADQNSEETSGPEPE